MLNQSKGKLLNFSLQSLRQCEIICFFFFFFFIGKNFMSCYNDWFYPIMCGCYPFDNFLYISIERPISLFVKLIFVWHAKSLSFPFIFLEPSLHYSLDQCVKIDLDWRSIVIHNHHHHCSFRCNRFERYWVHNFFLTFSILNVWINLFFW